MTMVTTNPWNDPERAMNIIFPGSQEIVLPEQKLQDVVDRYNQPGQGMKYDNGKLQWDLMPYDLLEHELRVWMFGAKKYAAHNWRKGMPMTQSFNALMRHLTAFMNGEDNDPESSLNHLAHAACCLKMMQNTYYKHPHLDDRYVTKE